MPPPPSSQPPQATAAGPPAPSSTGPPPAAPPRPPSPAVGNGGLGRPRSPSHSSSRSSSLGSHVDSDDDEDDDQADDSDDDGRAPSTSTHGGRGGGGGTSPQHQHQQQAPLEPPSNGPPSSSSASKKGKPKDGGSTAGGGGANQPARKQNVACDPCRSRKVKCLRTNGSDRCDSCLQKNLVCTNHYVTSLQNKERRKPVGERVPRVRRTSGGDGGGADDGGGGSAGKKRKVSDERLPRPHDLGASSASASTSYPMRTDYAHPPAPAASLYASAPSAAAGPSSLGPSILPPPPAHQQMQHQPAYAAFLPAGAPAHYGGQQQPPQQQQQSSFGFGAEPLGMSHPLPTAALQQQRAAPYLPPPHQQLAPSSAPYGAHALHAQPQSHYRPSGSASAPPPPPPSLSPLAHASSPTAPLPAFPPPMPSLLAYLFSPTEVRSPEHGYTDQTVVGHDGGKRELFAREPSQAHRGLLVEALRRELAADLIESYFQIVHIRMPMLAQSVFKAEVDAGTVSHVKLAVVLALGAKFSEHPIIAMDREQTSDAPSPGAPSAVRRSTSRLVRLLVARAQQVLEVHRAYRTPTLENIQAALLMEGLLNPKPAESTPGRNVASHSKGFWTTVAIRHLLELRCNHMATILGEPSELRRGALLFAWWLACLSDSMGALFWRQKPVLCDNDYDNEPPAAWDGEHYHPVDNPEEYKKWYMSAHDLAKIAREACSRLWTPRVEKSGVPLAALQQLVDMLCAWRDVHLGMVAVPNQWPASWDFVHAVTACAADSNFHVVWLTIHRAMVDFDIFEHKEIMAGRAPPSADVSAHIEALRSQLDQEAAHAATRISALAVVLTTNGYLRLDPNVLHYPIHEAGTFLARYGMPEVAGCIDGLRQYGASYEECYTQADALQVSFDRSRAAAAAAAQQQHAHGHPASFPPLGRGDVDMGPGAGRLALDGPPPEFQHQAGGKADAAAALSVTPTLAEQQHPATLKTWSISPSSAAAAGAAPSKAVYTPFPAPTAAATFAQGS